MDSRERELKPSGKSKSTTTAVVCSPDISRRPNDSPTSESAENTTCEELMFLAEAFPVRTFPAQDRVPELTGRDQDSGPKCTESFANYDQDSSSWKTSQICLSGEWEEFSGTWPRHGLMRNGQCSPAAPLVLHTCDSVCSSWPTPMTQDVRTLGPLRNLLRWYSRSENGEIQRHVSYTFGAKFGMRPSYKVAGWLMGFPLTWMDGVDTETQSSRKSRNGSGEGS